MSFRFSDANVGREGFWPGLSLDQGSLPAAIKQNEKKSDSQSSRAEKW